MGTIDVPLRPAGVAFGLAGLFLNAPTPFHPTIFHGDIAGVVLRTDGWEAIHLSVLTACVLSIFGTLGLVAAHPDRLAPVGLAVWVATTIGSVAMGGIMLIEALAFPLLAEQDPGSLDFAGPLIGSLMLRSVAAIAGLYPVGVIVLGVLAARATLAPRAGLALAGSGAAFMAFEGPFVPVIGPLSCVLFAGAHLWWGWILWQEAAREPDRDQQALRRVEVDVPA